MDLSRVPPSLAHRVLRVACGLPPGVQRVLAGPAVRIDGQELAVDIQLLLRIQALTGSKSVADGLSTEEAREKNRREAAAAAGPLRALAQVRELTVEGAAGPLAARLYVPFERSAPGPLLVYFHGGGWVLCDLDTHDGPCRFLATQAGVPVLSIDYRLAPEHPFPAAAEDAFAAFKWAVSSSSELAVDPARIAVGGDSAGGNIAAVTSLLARGAGGPQPAMQLLLYPVTHASNDHPSRRLFERDFLLTTGDMNWFEDRYVPDEASRSDPRVSVLEANDLSRLPPAYVATAGFDPLRDEGEAFAEQMREAGGAVVLRRHPELSHSFANLTAISRTARAAMHEAAGALRMGLAPQG